MSQFIKLTPEQVQMLKHHGEDFKLWINTEKGRLEAQEHVEQEHYFKEKLSSQNLNKISLIAIRFILFGLGVWELKMKQ